MSRGEDDRTGGDADGFAVLFFLSFDQKRLHPLPVGGNDGGLELVVDDLAGSCAGRLFDILDDGIIHRHQRGISRAAVIRGDDCCFFQRGIGDLFAVGDDHRMGTGDLLGMISSITSSLVTELVKNLPAMWET